MKLVNLDVREEGGAVPTTRVAGTMQSQSGKILQVWVQLPTEFEPYLSRSGDAWLILMALYGALHREDVEIELPVDPLLLRGVRAVAATWAQWYDNIHIPQVDARRIEETPRAPLDRAASFFSGGVDSIFTALRHSDPPDRAMDAAFTTDCIIRNYHELPVPAIPRNNLRHCQSFADERGKTFIPLSSNAMVFDARVYDRFAPLTHGAILAFLAHILGGGLSRVLVASSVPYGYMMPWGSHPLTDPLFSSTQLQLIHDGCLFGRFEKLAYFPYDEPSLRVLSPCNDVTYDEHSSHNCSRCRKCIHAMTAFDLLGVRPGCFDWSRYTYESFGQIYYRSSELDEVEDMLTAARKLGREDMVRVIEAGKRRSMRFHWLEGGINHLRQYDAVLRYKPYLVGPKNRFFSMLGLRSRL